MGMINASRPDGSRASSQIMWEEDTLRVGKPDVFPFHSVYLHRRNRAQHAFGFATPPYRPFFVLNQGEVETGLLQGYLQNQGFSHCIFISSVCGTSVKMAVQCHASHYWDPLIKKCIGCYLECERPLVVSKCISYCEAAKCKAQPGHYYDFLLKKCVKCAEVCGRHPAECSQHCQTSPVPLPKLLTTAKLEVNGVSHVPYSRVPTALGDSTILLYPLLALCLSLVFTSLSLALVVFLRGSRIKPPKPGPKEIKHIQECVVQTGQEIVQAGSHLGQRSKDFSTNSRWPIDRDPLDESSPTETCVCVHCFPDLKALRNHPPLTAPVYLYPQSGLHSAHTPNGGPVCIEGNSVTSGQEVQEEAAVE